MPEANEITEEVLNEFKERMKLGDDEDGNLKRILESSVEDLIGMVGNYDLHTDKRFKTLIFNHSRYEYNDAAEYFSQNFQTAINNLGISKALEEIVLEEETETPTDDSDNEETDPPDEGGGNGIEIINPGGEG